MNHPSPAPRRRTGAAVLATAILAGILSFISPAPVAASTASVMLSATNDTTGSGTDANQGDDLSYVASVNPKSTDGTGITPSVTVTETLTGPASITDWKYPPGYTASIAGNTATATATNVLDGGTGGLGTLPSPTGTVSSGTSGDGYQPIPFPALDRVCYVYHHAGPATTESVPNETACSRMSDGAFLGSWDAAPGSTSQEASFAVTGTTMWITSQEVSFNPSNNLYLSCFDAATLSPCGSIVAGNIGFPTAINDVLLGNIQMRGVVSNAEVAGDGSIWLGDVLGRAYRCIGVSVCNQFDPYAGDAGVSALRGGNAAFSPVTLLQVPSALSMMRDNGGGMYLEWPGQFFGGYGSSITCVNESSGAGCGLTINATSDTDYMGAASGTWPMSLGQFPGAGLAGSCFFSTSSSTGAAGIAVNPANPVQITCAGGFSPPPGLAGLAQSAVDPASIRSVVAHGSPYVEGNRMWFTVSNDGRADRTLCYDYGTGGACAGFTQPSPGNVLSYAVGGSPSSDCMYGLSDRQVLWAFGKNTGNPYCGHAPAAVTANPTDSYCSSGDAGWQGWNAATIRNASASDRYRIRLLDSGGNEVFNSVVTGAGSASLAAVPKVAPLTAELTYETTSQWTPSVTAPSIALTWVGADPEFCLKAATTTVCVVPAPITNTVAVVTGATPAETTTTSHTFDFTNDRVLCPPIPTITKTDGRTAFQIGDRFDYTVRVSNQGWTDDHNVSVVDTVPTGLRIDSVPSGCTAISQTVICNLGTLVGVPVGGPYLSLVIGVTAVAPFDKASQDAGTATNTVQLKSDACPAGCNASDTDILPASVGIITKVNTNDANSTPGVGLHVGPDTFTYTYEVTNTGATTLFDVAVTGTGTPTTSISCPLDPGASAPTTTTTTPPTPLLHASLVGGDSIYASLAPGQTIICTATTEPATPGQHSTVGAVAASTGDSRDLTATDPANWFGAEPAITIVKTVEGLDANTAAAGPKVDDGQPLVYRFTVTNPGNMTLSSVHVTDNKISAANIDCGDGSNVVTNVAPGASFTCTANAPGTWDSPHTNTARADGAEAPIAGMLDFTPIDVSATDVANTTPRIADVVVVKTATTKTPVNAGDPVVFDILVRNDGPDPATAVRFDDLFGNGIAKVDSVTGSTCVIVGAHTSCELGDMAPGAALHLTATATVADVTALDGIGGIWNYAKASSCPDKATGCTATFDPDRTNNSDDAGASPTNAGAPAAPKCLTAHAAGCYAGRDVVPVAQADVEVVKTTSTPIFDAGAGDATVLFHIDVRNNGPQAALDVHLSDAAQAPMVIRSIAAAEIASICATGAVTCALGDLQPGETRGFDVTATVPKGTVDPLFNLAEAKSTKTYDPKPKNNRDGGNPVPTAKECKAATPARSCYGGRALVSPAVANLKVTKVADKAKLTAGQVATWTVVVENLGPQAAQNATLAELGGPNHTIKSVQSDSASCTVTGCDLGVLATGSKVTVVVKSVVRAGTAVNTVTVATSTTETRLDDNEASAKIDVANPAPPLAYTGSNTLALIVLSALSVLGGLGIMRHRRRRIADEPTGGSPE